MTLKHKQPCSFHHLGLLARPRVLSGTNVWFTHTISFSVRKQCFSHRDRRGVHLFLGDVAEVRTRSLSAVQGVQRQPFPSVLPNSCETHARRFLLARFLKLLSSNDCLVLLVLCIAAHSHYILFNSSIFIPFLSTLSKPMSKYVIGC